MLILILALAKVLEILDLEGTCQGCNMNIWHTQQESAGKNAL